MTRVIQWLKVITFLKGHVNKFEKRSTLPEPAIDNATRGFRRRDWEGGMDVSEEGDCGRLRIKRMEIGGNEWCWGCSHWSKKKKLESVVPKNGVTVKQRI